MSLLTYVKENPIETAINVATFIPVIGGVIRGGSLLYKAGKTLSKFHDKVLKSDKKYAFNAYIRKIKDINKKLKDDIYDNAPERVSAKLTLRKRYKTIKDENFNQPSKPVFLKQTLLKTTKAQQGSALIVGGIGTTAHLKGLQK
nr:hypothetical protein [uncultured Mediterranean phage uvMED]